MRFVKKLNHVFNDIMENNPQVYMIGEDISDPYGGAFKVTKGLSTQFPDRIVSTPISEPSIVGMGIGMAMRGLKPIVEIMFGDFLALTFDQLLNSATKFKYMYDNKVGVPIIIRTPMGGGRGYGPTHSQSIEKFFLGIPGLKTVALSHFFDLSKLMNHIVNNENDPILIVEHKLLYPEEIINIEKGLIDYFSFNTTYYNNYPVVEMTLTPLNECDITVLAYGYTAKIVKDTVYQLMIDDEISCNIIIPSLLSPFDFEILQKSIEATGRLVIVEEGTMTCGFGSEIAAVSQELFYDYLKSPVKRIASTGQIIPSAKHLESEVLISGDMIQKVIKELLMY